MHPLRLLVHAETNHDVLSAMHEELLRQAIELGRESLAREGGGPFGALIARGETCIATGENRVVSAGDPTAHAEVSAIRAACSSLGTHLLTGYQLYTSCEPCPMCLSAAYWARVDRIYFAASRGDAAAIGFDDAFLYREISLPLSKRTIPTLQSLQQEGQKMMKLWHDVPAERHY